MIDEQPILVMKGRGHFFSCSVRLNNLFTAIFLPKYLKIGHFTVVYSVTRHMNGSEAAVDLVLIQTSLFFIM